MFCLERIAQLDPENPARQLRLAEAAERISRKALAARAYLRAGQLATAHGEHDDALKLLYRAYVLAPQERSVALLYAEAKLRAGMATEAVVILDPFAGRRMMRRLWMRLAKRWCVPGNWIAREKYWSACYARKMSGRCRCLNWRTHTRRRGKTGMAVDILLPLEAADVCG